jgi:hypothetical protein
LVIDPVALVVAADEPSADEVGHGATDIASPGVTHARPDMFIDDLRGFVWVSRQAVVFRESRPHLRYDGQPTRIALCHRHQAIAQRDPLISVDHIGPGTAAILAGSLGDQVKLKLPT